MRLLSLRADSRAEALPEVPPRDLRRPSIFVRILDLLIATYAAALLLFLLTGGVDLGVLTIRQAAKPLLVLAIAVPLRLSLNQSSWLLEGVARTTRVIARPWRRVRSTPLARALMDVAFAVIVTRIGTLTIGFIVNLLFSPSRARSTTMPFEAMKFAEIFVAWDSGWYFDIAKRGYYYSADGQSSIAFFPVYPMLMRALAWPFGSTDRSLWVAGIVVSCVAFVLALMALHRFAERVLGSREGLHTPRQRRVAPDTRGHCHHGGAAARAVRRIVRHAASDLLSTRTAPHHARHLARSTKHPAREAPGTTRFTSSEPAP